MNKNQSAYCHGQFEYLSSDIVNGAGNCISGEYFDKHFISIRCFEGKYVSMWFEIKMVALAVHQLQCWLACVYLHEVWNDCATTVLLMH